MTRFNAVKHYHIFLALASGIRTSLDLRNFCSHSQICRCRSRAAAVSVLRPALTGLKPGLRARQEFLGSQRMRCANC